MQRDRKSLIVPQLMIYPKFQLTLILINIFIIVMPLSFVAYKIMNSFDHMRFLGIKANFSENHSYFRFISMQETSILWSFLVVSGICLLVSSFIYLILSHKLAGPIVRLTKYFTVIADGGQVGTLAFRKKDFFSF